MPALTRQLVDSGKVTERQPRRRRAERGEELPVGVRDADPIGLFGPKNLLGRGQVGSLPHDPGAVTLDALASATGDVDRDDVRHVLTPLLAVISAAEAPRSGRVEAWMEDDPIDTHGQAEVLRNHQLHRLEHHITVVGIAEKQRPARRRPRSLPRPCIERAETAASITAWRESSEVTRLMRWKSSPWKRSPP